MRHDVMVTTFSFLPSLLNPSERMKPHLKCCCCRNATEVDIDACRLLQLLTFEQQQQQQVVKFSYAAAAVTATNVSFFPLPRRRRHVWKKATFNQLLLLHTFKVQQINMKRCA